MKTKTIILGIAILLNVVNGFAQTEIGGIYYNLFEMTAEVTKHPSRYSGDIVIPSTINHNGKDYSVTNIGFEAFFECYTLTSVIIPNSITSIGDWAFSYCNSLTSITIPSSVTHIGNFPFYWSYELTAINVDSGNVHYSSDDGVLLNKDKTMVMLCPTGKWDSYTIPNTVTDIKSGAFEYCYRLTSVYIPNNVTNIGSGAFYWCNNLREVEIPESVTSIGSHAFGYCNITSITIPNGITDIHEATFEHCISLTEVNISESVVNIGPMAFLGCGKLEWINIPEGVASIGYATFAGCSSLELVAIPSSVISIDWQSFYYCSALTFITLPSNVNRIIDEAFSNCTGLTLIVNLNPVPVAINSNVFENVDKKNCTLKVLASSINDYQNAEVWKEFNIVGIEVAIEPIEASSIKVYPNPTNGELRIKNYELGIRNIRVYDIAGQLVLERNHVDNNEAQLDLSDYADGVYFLKVDGQTVKVVKR